MENYLKNLSQSVPSDALIKMRKLKELKPYLPLELGGLTIEFDESVEADTAASRMGSFTTLSNTPATQIMTRPYDPRDIAKLAEDTVPRDYDPELASWEGDFSDILKPRGGRNPFHLLEQMIAMGPTGSPVKRGPAPIEWNVFYNAVDSLVSILRRRIGDGLTVRNLCIATPQSSKKTLKLAHVLGNSAGNPFFSDPKSGRTAKKYHIRSALRATGKFLRDVASLPLWPFLVFARGDRAADWELFMDCEKALDKAVLSKRDRKIDAQSFTLQMLDGMFTQELQVAISEGPVPEIDMRDPSRLSNHFEAGYGIVQTHGDDVMSIGRDESSWDQHVTPQGWYACYLIYRALFAKQQSVLLFDSDSSLIIEQKDIDALQSLGDGESRVVSLTGVMGEKQFPTDVRVTRLAFETEPVLRRMFAGVSGTDGMLGNVRVSGYKHVLDTPRDGKIQLGWSMRSGNYCTFLANSLINWHKTLAIEYASKDDVSLQKFKDLHGYTPPAMSILWLVIRGDDAGDVWEIKSRRKPQDWRISELIADWLTFFGASANAKKQDTSDERGRWRLGFAQLFTNENYIHGVSSAVRVLERNIWNEADEVVTVDPDTGQDLRPYLLMMNTFGRVNNLWGVWGREKHPAAVAMTELLQDLDTDNRLLPPLDEEARYAAARAWALKLYRRGQIAASQIEDVSQHFWTTELPQFSLERYEATPKLQDKSYAPIKRYGDDARPHWRKC